MALLLHFRTHGILQMRKLIYILLLVLMAMSTASCVTARRVDYLQDMTQGSQIEIENRFEARIAPYDELSIIVKSSNVAAADLASPFNQGETGAYLVDVNGDITLPTLGNLHVTGLTRLQLQDTLTDLLTRGGYLTDPFVLVRFTNFKIFFLSGGTGKTITIPNERCTFLEAIAMLGGLDLYTPRDRIAVMREVDGRMVTRYLDPRSSDVFNDPFFMLQQNDFIIAPTLNNGIMRNEASYWIGLLSTGISLVSLVVSIAMYRQLMTNNQ